MVAARVYEGELDAVDRVCVFVHLRRGGVSMAGIEERSADRGRGRHRKESGGSWPF
jgi:hypothetical protein